MTSFKHVPPGKGPQFSVIGGDVVTLKAIGTETEQSYTVIETVTPPDAGPPRHVHHRHDETFYIVDGELEFTAGDATVHATAGSFLIAPRGIPHQFRNVGQQAAKLLIIIRPSGFEQFIEEFAELPTDAPPDFGKMAEIAARHGIEFV